MFQSQRMIKLTFGATAAIAVCLCAHGSVHAASAAQPATQISPALARLITSTANMLPQAAAAKPAAVDATMPKPSREAAAGSDLFQNNCAFCHGRDAAGGESGPDLTRSKLVAEDKDGDKIFTVVRNGRPGTEMPSFNFSQAELNSLQAFIHYRALITSTQKGGRRGVDVSDLQTGNVAAGKAYFEGDGGCTKCHSATGDLAGIANRYQGLQLEMHMLYPPNGRKSTYHPKATITLPGGKTVVGDLAYRDDFVIGIKDSSGNYHSWSLSKVKYTLDDPIQAHIAQFPKYSDANVHDLMAYIQTLR
jgi:mono/diheme cytochrome c family protein